MSTASIPDSAYADGPCDEGLSGRAGQSFVVDASYLKRTVHIGKLKFESWVTLTGREYESARADPLGVWWSAYLNGLTPEPKLLGSHRSDSSLGTRMAEYPSDEQVAAAKKLSTVDLFCGSGGLSLGVRQLAAEIGMAPVIELAVDSDADATATLAANHDVRVRNTSSVSSLIDFRLRGWGDEASFTYEPEIIDERALVAGRAELLVAGPPCQGHSNLNNRSRRADLRNHLMLTVPAFAVAADIESVVIENVPDVIHDEASVVATTKALFTGAGYHISDGVLAAHAMGWPQTRRRYFMVAVRGADPVPLDEVAHALADAAPRSLAWALAHIDPRLDDDDDPLDQPTDHSGQNKSRIDWLFDNDEYDLALSQRPECHQDGTTYNSVYGRLRLNRPAPTITTGFTTPGRGRFVHPTKRRTLTPREAAVVQSFPLGYRFTTESGKPPSRSQLAKWIGDAVPMPLGYAAVAAALGANVNRS